MISSVNLSASSYRSPKVSSRNNISPSGDSRSSLAASSISVRIPDTNCVYSGGDGLGQTAYVEYTDASTESDPIVRISGHSLSGDYDETIHINNIDPEHATYPELCALLGHKKRIGTYQPEHGLILGVPLGVDRGDYSQAQNFMQKINGSVAHNRQYGNQSMVDLGESLLHCYENVLSRKAQETETTPADLLLDYMDRTRIYRNVTFLK